MNIRIYSNLRASLATLTLLAASLSAMQASAQAPAAPVQPGTASPGQTALPAYRSALEGYQRYTEEKTLNWKDANDATARIGGWRAYAKEASQPQAPEGVDKPESGAMPAKP